MEGSTGLSRLERDGYNDFAMVCELKMCGGS